MVFVILQLRSAIHISVYSNTCELTSLTYLCTSGSMRKKKQKQNKNKQTKKQ